MRSLVFVSVVLLLIVLVIGASLHFYPRTSNPTIHYTVVGTLKYANTSAILVGMNVDGVDPSFSPNLAGSFVFLAFNGTMGGRFPAGFASGDVVTVGGTISLDAQPQIYVLNVTSISEQSGVRERGEYWYNSDWVIRYVGYNPITSTEEAREAYLALIDKAPRKSYWIFYYPEETGMPLKLECTETGGHYNVNGTFRNFAVNCPDARLTIVYCIFKNGTANLQLVKTICPGYEHQEYP